MGPDFRVLVKKARKAAQKYKLQFLDSIPVSQLVREIASVMQEYTQSGYVTKNQMATGSNASQLMVRR